MDFTLSKEQQDIIKAAREFARKEFPERALEFDRTETFDLALWKKACELGFVGVFIDEKYDGAGYGFLEHCLITEEFWAVDPGIGQAILSATFGAELLLLFAQEDQKEWILPELVSGEALLATAITEPDAGSDVTGASTTAVQQGDQWVINGSKMFITNGDLAKYVIVYALTNPDHPSRHARHSFIIVPTDQPGFQANKIHGKLGIRASDTAELVFCDVKAPLSNLIGEEGEGFQSIDGLLQPDPPAHLRPGRGTGPGGPGGEHPVYQEAPPVRGAPGLLPGHPIQTGRNGHPDPGCAQPVLRGRLADG